MYCEEDQLNGDLPGEAAGASLKTFAVFVATLGADDEPGVLLREEALRDHDEEIAGRHPRRRRKTSRSPTPCVANAPSRISS